MKRRLTVAAVGLIGLVALVLVPAASGAAPKAADKGAKATPTTVAVTTTTAAPVVSANTPDLVQPATLAASTTGGVTPLAKCKPGTSNMPPGCDYPHCDKKHPPPCIPAPKCDSHHPERCPSQSPPPTKKTECEKHAERRNAAGAGTKKYDQEEKWLEQHDCPQKLH